MMYLSRALASCVVCCVLNVCCFILALAVAAVVSQPRYLVSPHLPVAQILEETIHTSRSASASTWPAINKSNNQENRRQIITLTKTQSEHQTQRTRQETRRQHLDCPPALHPPAQLCHRDPGLIPLSELQDGGPTAEQTTNIDSHHANS